MNFLSIDPGGKTLGWAYWAYGQLIACGLSRSTGNTFVDHIRVHKYTLSAWGPPDTIICERMMARGKFSIVDAQDLIDLNLIAGALGTTWLTPNQWKGSVPKDIHAKRILSKLLPEELKLVENVLPVSLRHNTIDAVGIGLYHLGRLRTCKPQSNLSTTPHSTKLPATGTILLPLSKTSPAKRRSKRSGGLAA